jgi:hypothetical protein
MRPHLILQPAHNSSADILKCFADGKPISADAVNYLDLHQRNLSSPEFDPVLNFYLHAHKTQPHKYQGTFLLHHEFINFEAFQELKKRIKLFLEQKKSPSISITLNPQQYKQFTQVGRNEIVYWHIHKLFNGAPMYPSIVPPAIFFQWGNIFGITKYLVLAGGKTVRANMLLYFEDMQNRNLDQCVDDYQKRFNLELEQQKNLILQHDLEPEKYQHFLIKQAHPSPFPGDHWLK